VTKVDVPENIIVDACMRGDIVQLRRWGRQGVRFGTRPLHVSAFHGILETVRCLVKVLGVDVNVPDKVVVLPCTSPLIKITLPW
jgi:hypothetical protein